jgi:ParB-like nuclease family protein/DUF3102 family protein
MAPGALVTAVPTVSDLAAEIQAEHDRALEAAHSAVEHAARCGELLLQAKDQAAHGEWQAWVAKHCTFSLRTAQGYMRLARTIEAGEAQRVAHLPLREALAALAEPREDGDAYDKDVLAQAALVSVPIDEIEVGPRLRLELGEMKDLIDSIDRLGLFHPILIDDHKRLICGTRRLFACKALGRKEVFALCAGPVSWRMNLRLQIDEHIPWDKGVMARYDALLAEVDASGSIGEGILRLRKCLKTPVEALCS